MATGGVRTLQFVLVVFVFSAGCVSAGRRVPGNYSRSGVEWGSYNPSVIVGKPSVLKIHVADDTSIKKLLVALTAEHKEKGERCRHLVTQPLHLRSHISPQIFHLHLRSYHTVDLKPGFAWICTSRDGITWDHQGDRSRIDVFRDKM